MGSTAENLLLRNEGVALARKNDTTAQRADDHLRIPFAFTSRPTCRSIERSRAHAAAHATMLKQRTQTLRLRFGEGREEYLQAVVTKVEDPPRDGSDGVGSAFRGACRLH